MSETLRIVFIGTGGIAGFHAMGYEAVADKCQLVAGCDLDRDKCEAYCKAHSIPSVYTDYKEMLEKERLDAVSVTTWNAAHCEPTIYALEHGVNVLYEKPMAMNAAQAQRMYEAAQKSGKLLQIGFVRRYGDDADTVKRFIDAGDMGDIYYAKATYLRRSGCPGGWFADLDYSGGGPLIDLGVHVMDLARYLAGKPKPVTAFGRTFRGLGNNRAQASDSAWVAPVSKSKFNCTVEDFASGMVVFDNGFTLSVEASFNLNIKADRGSLELFGTKAGAVVDGAPIELFTEKNGLFVNVSPCAKGVDFGVIFRRELAHFVDCVQTGAPCRAPAEDGVVLMKMIDALYESARTGKAVEIL